MIEINFYKKYPVSWIDLKNKALKIIDDLEKDLDEIIGDLPYETQYDDYRKAINLDLKTFILQVIVDWNEEDILYIDNIFYEKIETLEIDGLLDNSKLNKAFKSQVELLKFLSDEKTKLSTDDFDFIIDTFEENTIVIISSFDISFIDIDIDIDDEDDEDDFY